MNPIFITNSPIDGITSVFNNGSSVKVNLDAPIVLDPTKKYQMRVLSAVIVYCQPNITNATNAFSYTYNGTRYDKTIPVGNYSLTDINLLIALYTMAQNGKQLFAFTANEFDSTINVYFQDSALFINLLPNSFMTLLGFGTSGQIGYTTIVNPKTALVTSTQPAKLDQLQLIYAKCNITNGSYFNSQGSNIICSIPINAAPNSQILFQPVHPTRNFIFVNRIDSFQIDLMDQNGNALDFTYGGRLTVPENWQMTISIDEYDVSKLL